MPSAAHCMGTRCRTPKADWLVVIVAGCLLHYVTSSNTNPSSKCISEHFSHTRTHWLGAVCLWHNIAVACSDRNAAHVEKHDYRPMINGANMLEICSVCARTMHTISHGTMDVSRIASAALHLHRTLDGDLFTVRRPAVLCPHNNRFQLN